MCATCVAQGAAYLVPAAAVVKTRSWRRRRRRPVVAAKPPEGPRDAGHRSEVDV